MADEVYSKSATFRPLGNNLRMKPKGQFALKLIGEEFYEKGGDYSSFNWTPDIEENDVNSNEYPERTLALVDITKSDITIAFTARMATDVLRRISMLSEEKTYSQAAVAAGSVTKNMPVGKLLSLGAMDVTVTSVTGPADEVYVLGTHYELDSATGMIGILAHPDGVAAVEGVAEVTIDFTAPTIEGRKAYGFMSQTSIRATILFRQKVKWGPQSAVEFWDVQLRPDGDIVLGGDGDEFAEVSFTGRVFADPTRGAGYELGRAVDLPRAA